MSNLVGSVKKKNTEQIRISSCISTIAKQKYLFLLLLPGMLYFIVFKYGPLYGILLAFKEYDPLKGILHSPWVGLKYFKIMITMENFWKVLFNTLKISIIKILTGFPMPIIFALLLNEISKKRFKGIVQTISYLPHFLSWVIISGLVFQMMSPSYGLYGYLRHVFGWSTGVPLGSPKAFLGIIITSNIWKEVGYGSVIYLAAITNINSEMYESAVIDGASRFKQCIYITLPSILPTISILFILGLGSILDGGFDQIFNLYNPLVRPDFEIIDIFVYRMGLEDSQYSFATAVGLCKNLVAFVLVIFFNWLSGKYMETTIF